MDLESTLYPFLKIFYLLGLSPCIIEYLNPTTVINPTTTIYIICQAFFGIGLAASCFILMNFGGYEQSDYWTRNEVIIINVVLVCESIRIIFVFLQSSFYKLHIVQTFSILRQLDSFLDVKFKHRIRYTTFKRKYLIKIVIHLAGYTQFIITYAWHAVNNEISPIGVQFKLLQTIKAATILHIIFYVDLLTLFLTEFIHVIQGEWNIIRTLHEVKQENVVLKKHKLYGSMRDQFKFYKYIHFQLWNAVQHVNTYFGWALLAILIHVFVELVYSTYWLSQKIRPPLEWGKCVRK